MVASANGYYFARRRAPLAFGDQPTHPPSLLPTQVMQKSFTALEPGSYLGSSRSLTFLAGDQRTDGVFPARSVQQDLTICAEPTSNPRIGSSIRIIFASDASALANAVAKAFQVLSPKRERELTAQWKDKIEV